MLENIAKLEDKLVVISRPVGVGVYDFDFELHFACSHPSYFRSGEACVLRIGPVADYAEEARRRSEWGLALINSPDEHHRASELEAWYPLIAELTPYTQVFDALPAAAVIERSFRWPVFVKGSRQTSKHNPKLSVAASQEEYEALRVAYAADPILHWQRPVVREFVELDSVPGHVPGKVKASREFRTFWWKGQLVGVGQYWFQLTPYSAPDLEAGLAMAASAARILDVPFLVIDIAMTVQGKWTIIECNDGQESGYVGLNPLGLWRKILDSGA